METTKYFNFNENYNNKLDNHLFTTIRSVSSIREKQISIGDIVEVRLKGNFLFYAKVIGKSTMVFDYLSYNDDILMMLDTGMRSDDAVKFLRSSVGGTYCFIVTLESVDF